MKNAEKGIRFIDCENHELFRIRDGGCIIVAFSKDSERSCVCRYIDETHMLLDAYPYHIRLFAESMKKRGITYRPEIAQPEPESRTKMCRNREQER